MVENKLRQLIIISNCGFHAIHDPIKLNVGAADWNIKKLLQSAFRYFAIALRKYE